jgi:hypothetical protein
MTPQEKQSERDRAAALRSSTMLWTAGAGLVVVVFAVLGFSTGAPREFWQRGAIVVAVLLLVLRQVSRRLRVRNPRSAQPDPLSKLNLD